MKTTTNFTKTQTLDLCSIIWKKGVREAFNAEDFGAIEIMVDAGMTIDSLYKNANEEERDLIEESLPITLVAGTDEEGNFVSISLWAHHSVCVYQSDEIEHELSYEWLSVAGVTLVAGVKYYSI